VILILILLSLYCALLIVLQFGWRKAVRRGHSIDPTSYPLITVIVPVRNEAENIVSILLELKQQQYSNFEVIIVDDQSTDQTFDLATVNPFANVSILPNNSTGKKGAIHTGVAAAKGDLIVATDADCKLPIRWLESTQKMFDSPEVKFVFGAVGMESDTTFFSKLQTLEFASLIGSGAATAAFGFPTMCNGANLAFRKDAFQQVNGYLGNEHIASGDDEFLMRKIRKAFPGSVKFNPARNAVVLTKFEPSLNNFVNQRIRWAGKWKHNDSAFTMVLAIFILLSQLSVLAALVSLPIKSNGSVVILLLLKFSLEGAFIFRICRFTNVSWSFMAFMVLQVIYPVYVILVGIASNFRKPSWKGRKLA
jgi:cellulose synthase/poly-beta-1,6-N-acetylglucosamine synthase-like glycosyltransferase